MRIKELNIHHLRHIESARLHCDPKFNLIYGPNGSGKTSLLESIYLLSSGHSFRTREISPLVRHGENSLTVFARTISDETVSIQKSLSGPTQVKLNGQSCFSSSVLAHFLPCQVFYQDIFQVIDAGPLVRRMVLDWGLFHVEPSYHTVWKNYKLVLKQRNALLRQKANKTMFIPWDKQLVELGNELHQMRQAYFERWTEVFYSILLELTDVPCTIHYFKGWDKKGTGQSLDELLAEQFVQDQQRQFTHVGAHQADILFDLSSKKAKLLLSRGQQKIVLIALKLAQARLVPTDCIYLFDDVSAELDAQHLDRLFACLQSIDGQLFLTAIDESIFGRFNRGIDLKAYSLADGVFTPVSRGTF